MKKIYCGDGGGDRAVIPAELCVEMARRSGRSVASQVDVLAGNSGSGIHVVGLAAGVPETGMRDFYSLRSKEVFTNGGLGIDEPKYDRAPLDRILVEVLGAKKLSDIIGGPELFVPCSCIDPKIDAYFFKSWKARGEHLAPNENAADFDFLLSDVAASSSAAPYYFGAKKITSMSGAVYYMVDGGLHTNNPVLAAINEARAMWPDEKLLVLSCGTGERIEPLNGKDFLNAGIMQWALHLLDVAMDTTTRKDEYLAEDVPNVTVIRLQPQLPAGLTAMDDPTKIPELQTLTAQLIRDNSKAIDQFLAA